MKHLHECENPLCDNLYICTAPPDRCPIVSAWACPECEQNQRDEYFQQEQEPTSADHRKG